MRGGVANRSSSSSSPPASLLLWPWDRASAAASLLNHQSSITGPHPPSPTVLRTSYPPWPLQDSTDLTPLILLPLAPQLMPDLLVACDYHCCDVLDKVPPVEGVSLQDVRDAIWTFRSGVNARCQSRDCPPPWWAQLEATLDAASVAYWRPFHLPPVKAKAVDHAAALLARAVAAAEAAPESRHIKSFFSKVSAVEAAAAASAAAAAAAAAAAGSSSIHSSCQVISQSSAPDTAKASSIKSFFASVSEEHAEAAAAAALAATSANKTTAASNTKSAAKRPRAGCLPSPVGIEKFFGASSASAVSRDIGADGESAGIIVIDD